MRRTDFTSSSIILSKARFRRRTFHVAYFLMSRTFHVPFFIVELSTAEERRINQLSTTELGATKVRHKLS